MLEDELNVTVEVTEGGRRRKLSKAQISVRQVANKSAGGDLKAFLAAVDLLRRTGRLRENSSEPEAVFTQADLQAAAEILQFFMKKQGGNDDGQPE
jgi:hypothetical protein